MALFPMTSGGGDLDFFDALYGNPSKQTYTFPQNLQYCYICYTTDGSDITYNGQGTKTTIITSGANKIDKIVNVAANETVTAPELTFGSERRTIMFFMGKK